jgi:hypothetical protein
LASSVKPEELAAAAPKPAAPVPSPIQRTIDPQADAAESFLATSFKQPETREQIAERKRKEAAGLIDTIETEYQQNKAGLEKKGQERLAMDNAVSVLSGLTGSTEAARTRGTVLDANDKEQQALTNKKAQDLAKIYMQISSDAETEARHQMEDATKSAEEVVARRSAAQSKAAEQVKGLAAGGLVDFESFKNSPQNAKVYQYALDSVGGSEDALRAMFLLNRPKDQLVGTPQRIGNKYVQAYQNPITGAVKYESLELPFDLPNTYSKFEKLGDNLVAVPDNWDGDVSKLRTVAGAISTTERLQQESLALDIAKKKQEIGATAGAPAKAAEQKQQALALAQELRSDDAPGKSSAVGSSAAKFVPWGQSLGLQGDRSAFEARLNTLKSNLTLDNLKLLKGAMSDKDLLFLNSVGSSLSTDMSEAEFNKELDRIIEKLGSSGVTAPAAHPDLQPGEILVKDKASGQLGAIPENEFDGALYERQ